jgi:hypothetical protein
MLSGLQFNKSMQKYKLLFIKYEVGFNTMGVHLERGGGELSC